VQFGWVSSSGSRLSHFSDHYDSMVTKAKTLEDFSARLLPNDHLLSMDLRSGYHHFRFHPDIRKYFTVRVVMADDVERFFQYLVLPFGWSRSGYWFCRLVQRFWMMVKKTLGYWVLSYVDDFAFAPSLGRAATAADCRKASRCIDELLRMYGLTRHPLKGVWVAGSQCLQHLGFVIDTHRGLFGVPAAKLEAISGMVRQMLARARRNRRLVRADTLESFMGKRRVCVWRFQTRRSGSELCMTAYQAGERLRLFQTLLAGAFGRLLRHVSHISR
jgi:hypothetical protein